MAMKEHGKGEEEWDPVRRVGNPCANPLADSYCHLCVRGAKAGRGTDGPGSSNFGAYTHGIAERHVVAGAVVAGSW